VRDPRLTTLADLLCRYSLEVGEGDTVLIDGPALAQPLFVEVVRKVTELGAHPMVRPRLERAQAAFLAEASDEQLRTVTELDRIEIETPTRALSVWGQRNNRYASGIDPDRQAIRSAATRGLFERFFEREAAGEVRWCGTAFPCDASAQEAGMSLTEWENFVYSAGHLEDPDPIAFWQAQSERQDRIAGRLGQVRQLRIVGEDTDLRLDVSGRRWMNADGRQNFPDGEVFTSPVEGATEGHIAFSLDAPYNGNDVAGVRLWFEGGRVVREEATKGGRFLTQMLDMDQGARYLGEAAFGMNEEIRQGTRDTLFDEKIGGTCHVALGMGFPECGGSNSSGLHWDMVCDLRSGGEVYADGEVIYRDGQFL
jgi:aminopeptidase